MPNIRLAILLLLLPVAAFARSASTNDGLYNLCRQNVQDCVELSDTLLESQIFTGDDRHTLQELRKYTSATATYTASRLEQSFGKPSAVDRTHPPLLKVTWRDAKTPQCGDCGIQMLFRGGMLLGVSYAQQGRFLVTWYREPVTSAD